MPVCVSCVSNFLCLLLLCVIRLCDRIVSTLPSRRSPACYRRLRLALDALLRGSRVTQPGPGEVEPGPRRDWGYSLVSVCQSVLGSRSYSLYEVSLYTLSYKSVSLIVSCLCHRHPSSRPRDQPRALGCWLAQQVCEIEGAQAAGRTAIDAQPRLAGARRFGARPGLAGACLVLT